MIFVTSNASKLREMQEIVGKIVKSEFLEIVEIQGSLEEIAIDKALNAAKKLKKKVIVEDSALYLEALNDSLPGPYIKYFLDDIGAEGIYKLLDGFGNYKARATCTYALCLNAEAKLVHLFTGEVEGMIVMPRGDKKFGWDPIFQPIGEVETYAEMPTNKKNASSPRFLALKKLAEFVKTMKY